MIDALSGKVGSSPQMSGCPTNQELYAKAPPVAGAKDGAPGTRQETPLVSVS
jgi:hypothetical protein